MQAHRDAIQVQRELAQAQRELAQAQREVVQVNRVMAGATLLTLRGAQGCCELPCQDDELQADRQVGRLGMDRKKRVPSVLELLIKELPAAAGTGGACSVDAATMGVVGGVGCSATSPAGSACIGIEGVHAEGASIVQGTSGGDIGAMGLCTPPTRVGGHCCDTTPPKVPASPTTCKGSVMAQVMVLEEVIRGGGGKVAGDGEVLGARGGLAMADTNGRKSGHDLVVVEGRMGGMPRPPEHLFGDAGGKFEAGGGPDEHDTKSGCKSGAGGCNIVSGASGGGIVAIEEVKGGLPRPPELVTNRLPPIALNR